jgi:mxaJ protein
MCSAFRSAPSPLRGGPTRAEPERGGGRWAGATDHTANAALVQPGPSVTIGALRRRPPPGSAFGRVRPPRKGEEKRVPVGIASALALCLALPSPVDARELRVCADPNNLPFSNEAREGFENRIVELIARDLDASVAYTWWAQRRGFIRNTLKAGACDLVAGTPSNMEMMKTTRPYYRSTYVFVTRADAPVPATFEDPLLREKRVGVQLVGDDGFNTPPAHALARRGIVQNVRGYSLYGDYSQANPPARIVEAVAKGEVDVAVVWGPLAGYFAGRLEAPLRLAPVKPQFDGPRLPMVFDISMGVRKEDVELRQEIDGVLARRRPEIDAILAAYGVPRVDAPTRVGAVR